MRFPSEERFGLTSQMRRAAFSVAANIVEGYAFPKSANRRRFLRIAIASLAELGYAMHFARRVGYVSDTEWSELNDQIRQTAAPLHGLIRQQSRAG
jgi:four helix bundle protein